MRSDTLRTDAKTLPPVPTANAVESEKRKSLESQESKKAAKNGAARKGSAAKEAKKSTNRSVRKSEKSAAKDADRDCKSSEHRTKDTSDRDAKAKKFTLEPEKYAHLPVYDKKEEARKAREREKKVSEIFNDVNDQLDDISKLTTTHMEDRGMNFNPFQEVYEPQDVHTIRFEKGVLKPRNSQCQTQVMTEKVTDAQQGHQSFLSSTETKSLTLPPECRAGNEDIQKTKDDIYQDDNEASSVGDLDETSYQLLGEKFIDLTAKMKSVSHSFNDQDIPFIDSEDPETKLERELHQSLGASLDLEMKVSRIQLETSNKDNPSSTLVVAHRQCMGTETVASQSVRREYNDI